MPPGAAAYLPSSHGSHWRGSAGLALLLVVRMTPPMTNARKSEGPDVIDGHFKQELTVR